jgi:DNA-binding response OmpR family regulator
MNILIIGSDVNTINDLCSTFSFKEPDWEISVTDSYKECLDELSNGSNADMVIFDLKSRNVDEDMTGLDFISEINDISKVPVVVTSYDPSIEILVKAFSAGASDYVVKPFNRNIFYARIKALLRRKQWDLIAETRINEMEVMPIKYS